MALSCVDEDEESGYTRNLVALIYQSFRTFLRLVNSLFYLDKNNFFQKLLYSFATLIQIFYQYRSGRRKLMTKISYTIVLFILLPYFLSGVNIGDPDIQKTITISGYVSDAESGERLVGVTIIETNLNKGTSTIPPLLLSRKQ